MRTTLVRMMLVLGHTLRTVILVILVAYGLFVTLAWFSELVGLTPAVRGTPTRVQYVCTSDAQPVTDGTGE